MRLIKTSILTLVTVVLLAITAFAVEWTNSQIDSSGNRYYDHENGGIWYASADWMDVWYVGEYTTGDWKNGWQKWYQLDVDGYGMRNGVLTHIFLSGEGNELKAWKQNDNNWFRTDATGKFLTNAWFQDTDGKWYYLGSDGAMLVDTTTPDGYYVGTDGVWAR